MGAIIWQKVTTCNTTGGAAVMGSFPFPRNGIIKLDCEFILVFKKPGAAPVVSKEIREKSKLTAREWNEYFYGHWNFPGVKQDKHLAAFPEELPKRLIKMFSFVGDTVLDPFLGSGTTSLLAKNLNRSSIGYEINGDFLPVIREKLGLDQLNILNVANLEIINRKEPLACFEDAIKVLPYIFRDPIRFDKKVDVKKLRYGSKIDNSPAKREEYYFVKEISSPETIVLSNGLKIRLLGVRAKPENTPRAIEFLREKTKGQKVFLKFDSVKYDKENNLLCYLYLKNKTFINAHYIRTGFVDVDASRDYKYKTKFLSLGNQRIENIIHGNKAYK